MKKIVGILVVLAAVGGGAYYYFGYGKTEEKPQVVQVAISQGTVTEQVQATGTLEALRTVSVGSQVSGTVRELFADYNSIVREGQVIAKLDPSLLQVQVEIQQANIERQETDIAQQRVQLENDQTSLRRTRELFDKGLANQQALEQSELQIKARTAQINSAEKQLVQARANLSQAKLNISYTEIKSPINGVVVNRVVDVGQTVQASLNTPQFFTIAADLRRLKLTAGVDEADIGKIQVNMPVTFTVDSYPTETFTGNVSTVRLNATNNQNVVTYPVWIDAHNDDLKLRPAMTANVRIVISRATNVIRIPNQALRFRPTSDMYTALGLTPPASGRGQTAAGRAGGRTTEDTAAATPAPGAQAGRASQSAQAAGGSAQRQAGQGRQGQTAEAPVQGQTGRSGQGFGRGGNLSPEERERMRQEFAAGGGRGGARGSTATGRTGGRGTAGGRGAGANASAAAAPQRTGQVRTAASIGAELEPLNADRIDELFQPTPEKITNGSVWVWDEANKKLTDIRITTGVTDGSFSALRSGDVKVGQQVVTAIVVPQTSAQRNQSIFGGQQGGRGGGLQPGGLPGGGAGGFGAQPQGGGGARGGGGGGGRGGE